MLVWLYNSIGEFRLETVLRIEKNVQNDIIYKKANLQKCKDAKLGV